jgi:hypothetical protein
LQENLDLEKAQTVQVKTAMNELKTKLDMAESEKMEYQQIILTFEMRLW